MVDHDPDSPFEEIASDIEEGSFVEEQRLSEAADELSEEDLMVDSHPMQTRTRTALQEGRPRRRFEQYADFSSVEEPSSEEEVPCDIQLPRQEEPEDFFMEDLFLDAEDDLLRTESPGLTDVELYPDLDWNREPTPQDQLMSDYSTPGAEDPLDSVLRRELPRTTNPSSSNSDTDENRSQPIESRVEHPPRKRRRRSPQRYSPSMTTEPVAGPSRLTTGLRKPNEREAQKRPSPSRQTTTTRENLKRTLHKAEGRTKRKA